VPGERLHYLGEQFGRDFMARGDLTRSNQAPKPSVPRYDKASNA
jgi:hypothetical protein